MTCSTELTEWLCRSRMGTSLRAHLPSASRDNYCHLCDLPLDAKNDALPCLHWLIAPYCKPERLRLVFANYGVTEVVRYLVIWTLAEAKRPSGRNLRFTAEDDGIELFICLRKRTWCFRVDAGDEATFEYTHGRTGFTFQLPLVLQEGELEALRELCRFRGPALKVAAPPAHAKGGPPPSRSLPPAPPRLSLAAVA